MDRKLLRSLLQRLFPPRRSPWLRLAALMLALGASTMPAQAQVWTDWTALTEGVPSTGTGTIMFGPGDLVNVTFTGYLQRGESQTDCADSKGRGINYFGEPYTGYDGVPNRPYPCDAIATDGGGTGFVHTFTFSRPVLNPFMAFASLGTPSDAFRYTFDAPFDVIDSGNGFAVQGKDGVLVEEFGNTLRGEEGNGIVQFRGRYSSISFTASGQENWHAFTVGAATVTPEPATLMLLGTGLVGLAGAARRRRRR